MVDEEFVKEVNNILAEATDEELTRIEVKARMLSLSRWKQRQASKDSKTRDYKGLANFMTGVVQAMALRQLLRWSRGHKTPGMTPTSGEMWLPFELINASNALVNAGDDRMRGMIGRAADDALLMKINPFYTRLGMQELLGMQVVINNHSAQ
jgi:hypothetical protein